MKIPPQLPPAPSGNDQSFLEPLELRIAPAVFIVNSVNDDLTPDDNLTTLREAINAANAQTKGKHQIKFDPTVFEAGSTIVLNDALGTLSIDGNLAIIGLGQDRVTVSGNSAVRIFSISDGESTVKSVSLSNLSLINGSGINGGAISSTESLVLNNVTISGNSAMFGGGVFLNTPGSFTATNSKFTSNAASDSGGALHLQANKVTLKNVEVTNNTAAGQEGAGLRVEMNGSKSGFLLEGSTVIGNALDGGTGGGLWLGKTDAGGLTATIKTSVIQGNTAGPSGTGGGMAFFDQSTDSSVVRLNFDKTQIGANRAADFSGVYAVGQTGGSTTLLTLKDTQLSANFSVSGNPSLGRGGALGLVDIDLATVDKSLVLNNEASFAGGAIYNQGSGLTIKGSTLSGNQSGTQGGALYVSEGSTEIISSILSGNLSGASGGAVAVTESQLELNKATLEGNRSNDGGAISLETGQAVMITGTTFTGNQAERGGAIFSQSNNSFPLNLDLTIERSQFSAQSAGVSGGALHLRLDGEGTAVINRSSFTGNYGGSEGGAISVFSDAATGANFNSIQSTFQQNGTNGPGGGIFFDGTGTLASIITNATFRQNFANGGGGAVAKLNEGGDVQIVGSTITGNASINFGGGLLNDSTDASSISLSKTQVFANASPEGGNLHPNVFGTVTGYVPIVPKPLKGTHEVTNLNDSGAGSLRQAIIDANADNKAATIVFNSSLAGMIVLESDLPTIAVPLKLLGSGVDRIAISGEGTYKILTFDAPGAITQNVVSGVTLSQGLNPAMSGGGGAIHNAGGESITVERSAFLNNAGFAGGAIWGSNLFNIQNSIFVGNSASTTGGAIQNEGSTTIAHSFFYLNSTETAGAVKVNLSGGSALRLSGSAFANNFAAGGPGALEVSQADHFSPVSITNSIFNRNSTAGVIKDGGAITLHNLNPSNLRPTASFSGITVANNQSGSGAGLYLAGLDPTAFASSLVQVTGSKFFNNMAIGTDPDSGLGGGILVDGKMQLNLSKSVLAGNTASEYGGGVAVSNGAVANLSDVRILGNKSTGHGGGLAFLEGSSASLAKTLVYGNDSVEKGGGLYSHTSTLVDNGTRYIGNQAASGAGAHVGTDLGAPTISSANFNKSFFSGNEALSFGGALEVENAKLVLSGVTVHANRIGTFLPTGNYGGGLAITQLDAASSTQILKTVVSANQGLLNAGGLFLDAQGGTSHTISQSTFRDNYANENGGGLYLTGAVGISVLKTRIFDNGVASNSLSQGGGVFFASLAPLDLSGSSLTANSASWGGGYYGPQDALTLNKTTIANNSAPMSPNIAP